MKLVNLLLILFCGTCLTTRAIAQLKCGTGQYAKRGRNGQKICAPCPPGTFNSLETHSLKRCNYCTIPFQVLNERLLKTCTPSSDTQIGCHGGYIRISYRDTEIVEIFGKSYGKCVPDPERILTCGRGQYIQYNLDGVESCLPCPSGTFNLEDNHKHTQCTESKKPRPQRHEHILENNTLSSDIKIDTGCADGYYRNSTHHGTMGTNWSCEKCTICWQEKRFEREPCQPFRDTVCSEKQATEFICGKGQYVMTYQNNSQVCKPCPPGTYGSETEHTYPDCADCTTANTSLQELELKKCTPTSDTVIGCQADYFRKVYHQEGIRTYGKCQKCSSCTDPNIYKIKPCGPSNDAVCSSTLTCPKGHFVKTFKSKRKLNVCRPCPSGTFNTYDNHTEVDCSPCSQPQLNTERVLKTCTSSSDTEIGCVRGYYRNNGTHHGIGMGPNGSCEKCTICWHERRYQLEPCQPFKDTNCSKDQATVFICGKGQYVVTYENKSQGCAPCPPGTYNSDIEHIYPDCANCTKADPSKNELELKKCTPSSDAVIGSCQAGYFRTAYLQEEMKIYGECQKCSSCAYPNNHMYEIKPCGPDHDAVCGVTCPRGHFLKTFKSERKLAVCKPCPSGTFISTDNHTFTGCARCTQPEKSAHERTLTDCTPTSDTVIGCATGYVRKTLRQHDMKINAECRNCSSCEQDNNVTTPCKNFFDCVWEWLISLFN